MTQVEASSSIWALNFYGDAFFGISFVVKRVSPCLASWFAFLLCFVDSAFSSSHYQTFPAFKPIFRRSTNLYAMASNQIWFVTSEYIGSPVFNRIKISIDDVKRNGLFEACEICTRDADRLWQYGLHRSRLWSLLSELPSRVVKVDTMAATRMESYSSHHTSVQPSRSSPRKT